MIGGQGKCHLFHVNGEVRSTFDGNSRTKTIMGNREHKTTNFRWGDRGTSPFISGEHGDPTTFGGPRECIVC